MIKNIFKKIYRYLFKRVRYKIVKATKFNSDNGEYEFGYRIMIYNNLPQPYGDYVDLCKIDKKLFPYYWYASVEECEAALERYIYHLSITKDKVIKKGIKNYE